MELYFFKDIDNLKLKTNSSDSKLYSDNITVLIFKKSSDDKLIDTELLLYPQYISLKNQKNINNQKINNISQNRSIY